MATPNMGLLQPTPGTQGPDWANNINANSDTLDAHDHSPGKGVPVTPSGLNINASLNMNEQTLTSAKSVRFVSQSSTLTSSSARDLYIKNGDLFYANGLTDVQITTGGSVAGSSGSITGLVSPASAVFSGQQFSFSYDTGTYADLRCRDLVLSTNGGNTIKLTHAASSAYTLTLPPSPPSTASQMLTMGTTGIVSAATSPTLGTASDVFTWQGTTDSTLPTNGSVVLQGGLGIAKSARIGGGLRVNQGLSITTLGLGIDSGGASITGGLAVTGNSTLTGTLTVTGQVNANAGIRTNSNYMRFATITTNMDGTGRLLYTHGLNSNFIWGVKAFISTGGGNWADYDGYTSLAQMIITPTRIESSGNLPALALATVRLLITYHD